jgi:NaMN:DMB phosphoribosyltransferase
MVPPSLAVTQLSFAGAKSPALLAYEQGFVKEGMAAGEIAVAVSISNNQRLKDLQHTIYSFVDEYEQWRSTLPLDSEAEMD